MIRELNRRTEEILRQIVDLYMETGEPVASRTLSKKSGQLSPASIRNVMADLEAEGLLYAPHTSAGRIPTQEGLRFYVDGLMQVGSLTEDDRSTIEARCRAEGRSVNQVFEQASSLLSGLSAAAGLVVAPRMDKPLRHIQFLQLDPSRILVVLVTDDGMVENRIIESEGVLPESALHSAANYLNARLGGKTISAAKADIFREMEERRTQLDALSADLVRRGIAVAPPQDAGGHIIIHGRSRLLDDIRAIEDLEKARGLLTLLEEQETMAGFLEAAEKAEGVQVYIGKENRIFEHSGLSMIIAPCRTAEQRMIGAIGVIGPSRLNYGRIIPIVDYTSQVMQRILG